MSTNLHTPQLKNGCYKTRSESSIGFGHHCKGGHSDLDESAYYKKKSNNYSDSRPNNKNSTYRYRKYTIDLFGTGAEQQQQQQKHDCPTSANSSDNNAAACDKGDSENRFTRFDWLNPKSTATNQKCKQQQPIGQSYSIFDDDRFEFLKTNFDEYRRKTNEALQTKDAHICKLQERLNAVLTNERRGQDSNQLQSVHSLTAERDSLKTRLHEIETTYEHERTDWLRRMDLMKKKEKMADEFESTNRQRENENDKLDETKNGDSASSTGEEDPTSSPKRDNRRQCRNCDYLRDEMERRKQEIVLLNKTQNFMFEEKLKQLKDEMSRKLKDSSKLREDFNVLTNENDQLKSQIKTFKLEFVKFVDQNRLLLENFQLKRELDEVKDFYESNDIESEEKITLLANKIEELQEMLDSKNRECILLNSNLTEKQEECKKLEQKVKSLDANSQRQQDIIENLRDDLDKVKDKHRETMKERDDLLVKNASLSHEVNFTRKKAQTDRENILNQLNLAGKELEDCLKSLQDLETKMMNNNKNSTSNSNLANSHYSSHTNLHATGANANRNLAARINNLEETLKQKQDTIERLERRLMDIRLSLISKKSSNSPIFSHANSQLNSHANSAADFQGANDHPAIQNNSADYNISALRNYLLKLFESAENSAAAETSAAIDFDAAEKLARNLAKFFQFSADEEQIAAKFFRHRF